MELASERKVLTALGVLFANLPIIAGRELKATIPIVLALNLVVLKLRQLSSRSYPCSRARVQAFDRVNDAMTQDACSA
jgi:hypothetical protein